MITQEQKNFYFANGFLHLPGAVSNVVELAQEFDGLNDLALNNELENFWPVYTSPELRNRYGKSRTVETWDAVSAFKQTLKQKNYRFSKYERFLDYCPATRQLFETTVMELLKSLMPDPVLIREKAIAKYPGDLIGFPAHTDLPAQYAKFSSSVASVCVSLDQTSDQNGCVFYQPTPVIRRSVIQCPCWTGKPCTCITESGADPLQAKQPDVCSLENIEPFVPAMLDPGDILIFDGLTPHYSDKNVAASPRRYLYGVYSDRADLKVSDQGIKQEFYHWLETHFSANKDAFAYT
jgi:hypothetical protein